MLKPIFQGKVENGKLVMTQNYVNHLRSLESQVVDVTVAKHRNNRSLQQLRYYWAVVVKILSDELGYSLGETHEVLKAKFLTKKFMFKNKLITVIPSTTSLTTIKFGEYLTQIREWASVEFNILIPLPCEVDIS